MFLPFPFLQHIETAPKEILGDFPRLNRGGALTLINKMEAKVQGKLKREKREKEKAKQKEQDGTTCTCFLISDNFQPNASQIQLMEALNACL